MVEIIHQPFKQLIIMDYTIYSKPEALASTLSLAISAGQPAALYWCEGVAFYPALLPPETEGLANEYLKGRIYATLVAFAIMPTFQQTIKVGGIEVPVIDMTPNSTMREIARWLKQTHDEKQKTEKKQ